MSKRTDVAVIGGGLAGLAAAVALSDEGMKVEVFEADCRLGGRASSWTDDKTGQPVHIGPHIFLSAYPNMRKFLDRLGTENQVVWQPKPFITIVRGQRLREVAHSALPPPMHFVPSVLADPETSLVDLASNARVMTLAMQMTDREMLRLDAVNAATFLRRMGVTKSYIEHFWAFMAMSILNVPLELCSAGALLRFYQRLIGHQGYCAGFPGRGLGDLFAPAACGVIERAGGRVHLDTKVTRLLGTDDRVSGVQLADGTEVRARTTIAALTPMALRHLARPTWIDRIAMFRDLVRFQPCPYVSVYLWFDRKLTELSFWAREYDVNDLCCDFYDMANINPDIWGPGSVITTNIIYSSRADGMSDEAIVAAVVRELAEFLPQAASAELRHSAVHHIPMAIHCPHPGTEALRPEQRPPVSGLLLAGDWMRTGRPASMEGAVYSGYRAAEEALSDAGTRRSMVIEYDSYEGIAGLYALAGRWLPSVHRRRWLRRVGA